MAPTAIPNNAINGTLELPLPNNSSTSLRTILTEVLDARARAEKAEREKDEFALGVIIFAAFALAILFFTVLFAFSSKGYGTDKGYLIDVVPQIIHSCRGGEGKFRRTESKWYDGFEMCLRLAIGLGLIVGLEFFFFT